MNSPGHRANILNGNYQDVGFGIASSPDYVANGPQTVIVALYGKPLVSAAVSPVPPATSAASKPATVPAPAARPTTASQPAAEPATTNLSPETVAPVPNNAAPTANGQLAQISATVVNSDNPSSATVPPRPVSRLQTVAAIVPVQGVAALAILLSASLALFVWRHTRALHRRMVQGERFVAGHPYWDIGLALVIVLSIVLTRSAGFIN